MIALVGTGVVVLWQAVSLGRVNPRQDWGFLVLVLAGLAVGLMLALILPAATRRLLRHKDLLVPLGLYVSAEALLNALATSGPFARLIGASEPVKLFTITLTLSLALVVEIVLGVIYAAWTTALVLQAVREDRTDLAGTFADIGRWLRVLCAEFIGWSVLFAGAAVAIGIGQASIGLALFLIAALSLAWNLATVALLPVVVAERRPLLAALAAGFRQSRARMGRWCVPVVGQMVLLGWITFIHVSYTSYPRPGSVTTHTKTNWQVNAFWTGGYEDTCRWHGELMKAVEAQPLPLVNTLLGLMFGVLAVAIKLRVVAELYEPMPVGPAGSGEAATDGGLAV
ncbi:MAG TPA: hypothetical protein VKD90_08070 [Gemmataceae bacterium]|nr:hypothetical protein [Gemmataceae bacterium]